ncbi:MAG: sensor histidine kinase [Dehalococcoidia bacterium]
MRISRQWLQRIRPRFRDRHFWITVGLIFGVAVVHSVIEVGGYQHYLGHMNYLPVSLLMIPVLYAAIRFGLEGAIAASILATLITIPNWVLLHHGSERFSMMFHMAVLVFVAVLVGQRVDHVERARRQAQLANAALKTYNAHVLRVHEEERQRIARELHDNTIQDVILVCRRLGAVESIGESLSPLAADELREARKTAEQVVEGLRDYARALRPPVLDDLGLEASISRLLRDFMERTGAQGWIEVVGEAQRLPQDAEIGIFRIAQEALSNVERHSKATEVIVTLAFGEREVRVEVRDNGVGFKLPTRLEELPVVGRLGLLGIQERAELLGGNLDIESTPGGGTILTVSCRIASL